MPAIRAAWLVAAAVATVLASPGAVYAQTGTSIDAVPARVKATISVPPGPIQAVASGRHVFVLSQTELASARQHSILTEVDPITDAVVGKLDLGLGSVSDSELPGALAAGAGALWVTDYQRNVVDRIDPTSLRLVHQIPTGVSPSSVAIAFGSVWIAHQHDARLWRIDPLTDAVTARIQVDNPATYDHGNDHVGADSHGLLETIGSRHVVVRVSPTTNRVTATYDVAPAIACGPVLPVPGGFWLDDAPCSQELFHYDVSARSLVGHFTASGCIYSASIINGRLYAATSLSAPPPDYPCVDIAVQELSPSGSVNVTRVLPQGQASWAVQSMFSDLWVETYPNTLYRIAAF
jgi:hypothetical protein